MHRTIIAAFIVVGVSTIGLTPAAAQSNIAPTDSASVALMHRDSTSRLTLTGHKVVFEYTAKGVEEQRRRADSTTAAYADPAMARLVSRSIVGAFRGLHVSYDVRDFSRADVVGATVRLTFRTSPDRFRSVRDDDVFDFDATDARSAQAFADRVSALIAAR